MGGGRDFLLGSVNVRMPGYLRRPGHRAQKIALRDHLRQFGAAMV